jgi:hypothetical protein
MAFLGESLDLQRIEENYSVVLGGGRPFRRLLDAEDTLSIVPSPGGPKQFQTLELACILIPVHRATAEGEAGRWRDRALREYGFEVLENCGVFRTKWQDLDSRRLCRSQYASGERAQDARVCHLIPINHKSYGNNLEFIPHNDSPTIFSLFLSPSALPTDTPPRAH